MGMLIFAGLVVFGFSGVRWVAAHRGRIPGGIWLVFPLATLATLPAWWTAYGFILMMPLLAGMNSTVLCLVAGRRLVLWSSLFAGAVILPMMVHWNLTASPDQLTVYGAFPVYPSLFIVLVPAWLGALAAFLMRRGRKDAPNTSLT